MPYRLSLADDVATAVRAVAREQLEGAAGAVERAGGPGAAASVAVHDARRRLKKARALLRLVRPALGRDAYRRENGALREVAAALSATRDADVLVTTTQRLADRYAGRLPAADFAALRSALADEARAARDAAVAPDLDALAGELRAALTRVEAWPLDEAGWDDALAGAVREYRRGRDAFAVACAQPTAEHLHAWRKRVKDHWYHQRLLRDAFAPVMRASAAAAHELSEQLGEDHDLAVLRARLQRGVALPAGAAADLALLLALVDQRRSELERAARQLGGRLYAESPKAFARRLGAWLEAARAETAPPQPA